MSKNLCKHLQRVFEKFKNHNITVNLEKSRFFQPEVKFLRHVISTEEIRMDPEKESAVMKFEPPTNKKHIQSYLGFLNFYRKYIQNFAGLIQPLTDLLRKEKNWEWKKEHQEAFENSRKAFLKEIVVGLPCMYYCIYLY